MSAGTTISNFAKLAALDSQKSSETRRELLREVTSVLDVHSHCTLAELNGIDEMLAAVASQFSTQVRREFARQVATSISGFGCFTEQLAMDEIEVSTVILQHSRSITNDVLLKVIKEKSDAHRMQVTARADLSEDVSDALVQHGSDEVAIALLKNETARIAVDTYEAVAKRANTNSALQSPLVRRKGVPLDVLQELYLQVEGELRQEIVSKFGEVAPDELERAFARSRKRITKTHRAIPADFSVASQRVDDLQKRNALQPPILVTLLREGPQGRTAFTLALARLTEWNSISRIGPSRRGTWMPSHCSAGAPNWSERYLFPLRWRSARTIACTRAATILPGFMKASRCRPRSAPFASGRSGTPPETSPGGSIRA
jgi:uncharacterized protein (DUF2336 family)